jgi:hypothetical protein
MYPGSAAYTIPQNNQHVPPTYFNLGTPHTPSNPAPYYSETLSPRVHTNALPQFSAPSAGSCQPPDNPTQWQKCKRPTDKNQPPRRRSTDTPIRPLKGRELQARVRFLDDEIVRLKKDIGGFTRERVLLVGPSSM